MAATPEEVTVDLAALDAAAVEKAKKDAGKGEKTPDAKGGEPEVIVDPEVTAQKGAPEVLSPEKGLETLRKQLKDEQEARQAAEQARAAADARAAEASRSEAEARGRAQTTELDLVKNAIATVTQANDALESKYADAMAAQDWAAAAKLQRQMGDNSAKLAQLEAGKTQLEKQPKPTPRTPTDPVEALCAQLSAPSANWVRAHPEFARDPGKYQLMIAAHGMALAKGHKADSDEYFKSIEKSLDLTPAVNGAGNGSGNGQVHSNEVDPLTDPSASVTTGGRQATPAAAPVSRSGNGNGSRPNVVRLSADEVEIAQNMGMTPEEYARNKMALKKEGKLS